MNLSCDNGVAVTFQKTWQELPNVSPAIFHAHVCHAEKYGWLQWLASIFPLFPPQQYFTRMRTMRKIRLACETSFRHGQRHTLRDIARAILVKLRMCEVKLVTRKWRQI